MPLANLEIVEIMRRRDLHRARAFFRVGISVGDDRDKPSDERQLHLAADEILVALIVRMHGDRGVAEHGLRTRGRDGDDLARLRALIGDDRVVEVPERALHLDLLDFEVGDRGLKARIPIDEALVLVDEALLVELDEHLDDGLGQALVHGETFARPVAGSAEALQLVDDDAARFLLPGPDPFQEFLAPERAPVGLLRLHQLPLDHHLGRDAGVIGARLPQHVAPAHALEAAQNVLERIVERVPHVQRAGDVRRRDDDGVRGRACPLGTAGLEGAGLFPDGGDALLDCAGIESLVHHSSIGRAENAPWFKRSGRVQVNAGSARRSASERG